MCAAEEDKHYLLVDRADLPDKPSNQDEGEKRGGSIREW